MCDFPPILQEQVCIFPDIPPEEALMIETPEQIIASQIQEINRLNQIIRDMQKKMERKD